MRVSLLRRSLISSLFLCFELQYAPKWPVHAFSYPFYPTLLSYIGHMLRSRFRFLLSARNTISCFSLCFYEKRVLQVLFLTRLRKLFQESLNRFLNDLKHFVFVLWCWKWKITENSFQEHTKLHLMKVFVWKIVFMVQTKS